MLTRCLVRLASVSCTSFAIAYEGWRYDWGQVTLEQLALSVMWLL